VPYGISGGGRSAEDAFIQATGADPTPRAALGDAVLEGHSVEIKKASSSTLNQVRAVKYIPLVVYSEPDDQWYVVPAHVVVALVSRKNRGQHTENAFESATLSTKSLTNYKVGGPGDLREATLRAIAESALYSPLEEAMREILQSSKELASRSTSDVREKLRELGI